MIASARNAEFKTLVALREAIGLKAMGCHFDRGMSGGICVTFKDEGLGAWRYENGSFSFADATSKRPGRQAFSSDEVISATATIVALNGQQKIGLR